MKKLAVTSAVLAALMGAAPAIAGITLDVYGERVTGTEKNEGLFGESSAKQGVELAYGYENLTLSAEATTGKDLDLGASYKFELGENFYLKPSAGFVYKWNKKDDDIEILDFTQFGTKSNVAKFGVEAGAAFGDFFASARYRIDTNTSKTGQRYVDSNNKTVENSARSSIGRTDLLVGYNLENVTLTAKGIHKSELNKDIRSFNTHHRLLESKTNSFWSSELKATFTGYEGVAPYIQYAHNHDNHDNAIKLGAKFSF
ncbi:hypothetical protein [Vibrio panuliri]|uniref:Porin n=1 Tax=Vibrio panuliri TaxID=1381081 RepID=A0ABX3FAQ4_9VIBR|nr:hypothetical protein [Vibrio panuliri]KAB1457752.1 hypothetical protein F7O85_08435 [Vibrio panuliri]OLQ85764.1 hypothetical protein BIY20_02945 [Vibrio panuliri]